ncbi:MAG: 6-pyruvoyl tetrahydrobiopterin synthase, partial [Caulobacteraceae bacterium]|nr:6-pyruvoyl tetrahydrobiopterin synthase [Caulobacteraceae bacterium]
MGKFISTKTYGHERGYAVAYRQWRADTHCNLIHGYALAFHFEFECDEDRLDRRNWCVDFGGYKSLKERLDD